MMLLSLCGHILFFLTKEFSIIFWPKIFFFPLIHCFFPPTTRTTLIEFFPFFSRDAVIYCLAHTSNPQKKNNVPLSVVEYLLNMYEASKMLNSLVSIWYSNFELTQSFPFPVFPESACFIFWICSVLLFNSWAPVTISDSVAKIHFSITPNTYFVLYIFLFS